MIHVPQGKPVSDEIRIGACADYLLGKSLQDISAKWQISASIVVKWIKRTGSFKLRRIHKSRREQCPS